MRIVNGMNRVVRFVKRGGLFATGALMALSLVAPAAPAMAISAAPGTTVFLLAGGFGSPEATGQEFGGQFCKGVYHCQDVYYFNVSGSANNEQGARNLDAAIRKVSGPKLVFGQSEGALVADAWLRDHNHDATAPKPSELQFLLTGNTERKYTGYNTVNPWLGQWGFVCTSNGCGIPADTPYQVTDFCSQWDGWCDATSDVRSSWGMTFVHTNYANVNFSNPANKTWREGNVTYVNNPTPSWAWMGPDTVNKAHPF